MWKSENGAKMGISLVSSTRLNYDPKLIHIWKDIVYGFRQLAPDELAKIGRLTGKHRFKNADFKNPINNKKKD
jgi:hypothetical protein